MVFHVKVHTNPEVDSPFALGNLYFSSSPWNLAVTRPGRVSLRLLDEFHTFSLVKVTRILRSVPACTCDEVLVQRWRWVGFSSVPTPFFRIPSVWTSSALFSLSFWSPRWPTVVGCRGLLHNSSRRLVDTHRLSQSPRTQPQQPHQPQQPQQPRSLDTVPLMVLMLSQLLLGCLVIRMSGLMVVLFGIRSLGFLPLVLVSLPKPENCWGDRRWGHVNRVRPEGEVQSCRGFCSVPGPLCGASFWLSADAVHLGVDKLAVLRHVGRLLGARSSSSTPLVLVTDGDLLLLIAKMLHLRGLDTVQITKVKGHADEEMVLEGRVRELDRLGNHAADEAADFGRRRVGNLVIGARRNLSGVCGRWYLFILDLYRLFIAISGAVVNRDGSDGTALYPLVWSAGACPGGAG